MGVRHQHVLRHVQRRATISMYLLSKFSRAQNPPVLTSLYSLEVFCCTEVEILARKTYSELNHKDYFVNYKRQSFQN